MIASGKLESSPDLKTTRVTETRQQIQLSDMMMSLHTWCIARRAASVDSFWQARSRDITEDKRGFCNVGEALGDGGCYIALKYWQVWNLLWKLCFLSLGTYLMTLLPGSKHKTLFVFFAKCCNIVSGRKCSVVWKLQMRFGSRSELKRKLEVDRR